MTIDDHSILLILYADKRLYSGNFIDISKQSRQAQIIAFTFVSQPNVFGNANNVYLYTHLAIPATVYSTLVYRDCWNTNA